MAESAQLTAADADAAAAAAASARTSAALAGARLHWASSRAEGSRWLAPEPGWSTYPADSVDAGGGAWQSLLRPCETRAGAAHLLLLQLPADGGAPPAVAAIVKAPGNRWLGDAATRRDFYFDLAALPLSAPLLSEAAAARALEAEEEAAAADAAGSAAAAAAAAVAAARPAGGESVAARLVREALGLEERLPPLSALDLARPPPLRRGGGGDAAAAARAAEAAKRRRAAAVAAGAPPAPELPAPYHEGPPRGATQKATLLPEQLRAAAAARLASWAAAQQQQEQQHDQQGGPLVPAGAPRFELLDVEGFAAPLAVALLPMKRAGGGGGSNGNGNGNGGSNSGGHGVVAVVMVADEGFAGVPAGLTLHW